MSTAADRGWGMPPVTTLVRVPCGGLALNLRPEVAPLFAELIRRVEAVKGAGWMTSSGGYNNRPKRKQELLWKLSRNPKYLSNHAWALAADFRAGSNPGYRDKRTDMPGNITDIAHSVGLSWGGEWSDPYDPMHFEFLGTPAEAAEWCRRIANPTTQEDDVLKDQKITNPISGKEETVDVTIAYMEQRIVTSIIQQLPAAIWNFAIANPVAGVKESAQTALSYLESRITGRTTKKVS